MSNKLNVIAAVAIVGALIGGVNLGYAAHNTAPKPVQHTAQFITVLPCSAWANGNPVIPANTFTAACSLPDGSLSLVGGATLSTNGVYQLPTE